MGKKTRASKRFQKKNKRKISAISAAQAVLTSSESDTDISLHSTREEDGSSLLSTVVNHGDYVIVKVKSKRECKNFIALVVGGPDADDDFEVHFLKKCEKIRNGFVLSEELASANSSDILGSIPKPQPAAATKRLSGVWKFPESLTEFYNI